MKIRIDVTYSRSVVVEVRDDATMTELVSTASLKYHEHDWNSVPLEPEFISVLNNDTGLELFQFDF